VRQKSQQLALAGSRDNTAFRGVISGVDAQYQANSGPSELVFRAELGNRVGSFYTNIVLRSVSQQDTLNVLTRLRRKAFVSPTKSGITVVYDFKCEEQDTKFLSDLTGLLSAELNCAAWGTLNHDDDVLWYVLCSKGKFVDSYNSDPDYFEDTAEPSPPEGGNGKVLARLMGRQKSAAKADAILRRTEDQYTFASDRHRDLSKGLGIDFSLVCFGFDGLDSGEEESEGFVRIGNTMRLATAVRKDAGEYPGDGVVGRERAAWYSVANLRVASGGIEVADLGAVPGDSFRLRVPNGVYAVEARLIDFDGSLRVSRIRARLALQRWFGDLPRKKSGQTHDPQGVTREPAL